MPVRQNSINWAWSGPIAIVVGCAAIIFSVLFFLIKFSLDLAELLDYITVILGIIAGIAILSRHFIEKKKIGHAAAK